ncbi:MAG: STAS domain-containing protein [Rhodocyclaceae bacterium]|nr:STAS domain-containing protein [Rhodocyclaceae bacterium]
MSLLVENTPSGCRLRIDGEMTVACAANLRDEILAALPSRDGAEIEVDLSGVSEIDSAGLQLMLQLKRKCGPRLRLVNHSQAVLQILDLSNAAAHFGDPVVIPSKEKACP